MKHRHILLFAFLFFVPALGFSQEEDLLSLIDSVDEGRKDPVIASWKTTRVVNAHTTETVKKGTMDFRITHRFGNIGEKSNGGGHTLWGFDNSNDIRLSFDFGITDKLTLGVGRSKAHELIDGVPKYRFLEQTTDNSMPFTMCVYSNASYNQQRTSIFYSGIIDSMVDRKTAHRLAYTTQLIIGRKMGRVSFELLPTYTHRNFVREFINPNNNATDENDLFALGAAARVKVTNRIAILADYFHIFSDFRDNNDNYHAPVGIGVEIETGGHVFHLNLTNASGIIENYYIPNTTDDWLEGGYKFGFNISRVFRIGGRKQS